MTGAGVESVLDEVHQRPFIGVCDVLRCVDYADRQHQSKSPMSVRSSRGKFLRQSATLFNKYRQEMIKSAFLPQEVKDKTRILRKCPEYSQARMAQSLQRRTDFGAPGFCERLSQFENP
jgi:hypothetical protein